MKLEATKFRPREVVKHVLQTGAASLQKKLILEGHVADDVPVEVIGDVLRIRQILTNLISNAIKFTHEGKVGINLHVIPEQSSGHGGHPQKFLADKSELSAKKLVEESSCAASKSSCCQETSLCQTFGEDFVQYDTPSDGHGRSVEVASSIDEYTEKHHPHETIAWIRCDVYDTGIGIPEKALPTLFKKYMQVRADHARKYGGTGLGLAICKQLVELMGGHLTVTSRENSGSTFTFVLPCRVSIKREHSDDPDELQDMADHEAVSNDNTDDSNVGSFHFQPHTLGSLFSSSGSTARAKSPSSTATVYNTLNKKNDLSEESYLFPSNDSIARNTASVEDACSTADAADTFSELESSIRQNSEPDNENGIARGKHCQGDGNGIVMNRFHSSSVDSIHCKKTCKEVDNVFEKNRNCEVTRQSHENEKSVGSLQSISSSSLEQSKSKAEPRILLVEDNKINVMVTQSMMKQLGHSIDVVNNGLEAVRAVQFHRYDLILMDVCMPIMDGLKATRLIRSFEENGNWDASVQAGIDEPITRPDTEPDGPDAVPSTKRIPIIAMTANALAESAAECLANGMDSFVSKPVTFQKLKLCLQQYMPV